jgi:hypothetical protein|tara:strand:- start:750 stop:947 length:198 start_codon:yes stop_codon:yes gene_type:complete
VKVGDLVQQFVTEQIGVVLDIKPATPRTFASINVLWATQGKSLFVGPGTTEWCDERSLDVISESR